MGIIIIDGNHVRRGEIAHARDWVVNENSTVPFYVLGADHGLEHVDRSMKVSKGLVGVMFNHAARTKFSSLPKKSI